MLRPLVFLLRRTLLLSCGVCSGVLLNAEPGAGPELRYRVTRWTAESGLPQSTVKALVQTRDGYLWIGTLNGVARFDGLSFKVFDHNNTSVMTDESINQLVEDQRDDALWVSTGHDLLCYRDHGFQRFGSDQGLHAPVDNLGAARDGGIWFTPRSGQLGFLRDGKAQVWDLAPPYERSRVQALFETASELLLIADSQFLQFDSATKTLLPAGPSEDRNSCGPLAGDSARHLWLCTGSSIWTKEAGQWRAALKLNGSSHPFPQAVCRSRDNQLWVIYLQAGEANLHLGRVINDALEPFRLPELPADINVTHILEDREGTLWVGTTTGLYRLQPKRVRVFAGHDGLRNDEILEVARASNDAIYLGTADGISAIGQGVVTNLPPADPEPESKRVSALMVDHHNRVWCCCGANALKVFDHDGWNTFLLPPEWGRAAFFKTLYEDHAGGLWLSTGNQIFCKRQGQWTNVMPPRGLSKWDVRVIHQDQRGDMWFGCYGAGLYRLSDGRFTSYNTTRGDYNNRAWWIHEDANGVLWVGTQEGLNRFEAGSVFTFTTEHGLRENTVNNIQEDDLGYLWLSGLRGIYRVSRQDLNEVAIRRQGHVQVIAYGEADGMLNAECNGGETQPAGCKDRAGWIWFPTVRGVVAIDPKEVQRNEVPPPVVIEQVIADDEVIFGDDSRQGALPPQARTKASFSAADQARLALPAGHARVLAFKYTANSLTAPEKVRFRYRLEGYDPDWRDGGDRRHAFYTNLRPGKYRFLVTASNPHGVWSERPAAFAFLLAPSFHQTGLFYVLCGCSLIAAVAALQAYRLNWQRRLLRLEQQRALANERARIARDLHDDLGTALTGAALELDVIRRDSSSPQDASAKLHQSAGHIRQLAERMREVVWAINPKCDTVSSLASFLEQQAAQFLRADGLRVRLDFPEYLPAMPMPAEVRHQLALSVREAFTNVVRHASATEVQFGLRVDSEVVYIHLTDNGRGFDASAGAAAGQGLNNLRHRLATIGGSMEIRSLPGSGTTVLFRVPLSSYRKEEP